MDIQNHYRADYSRFHCTVPISMPLVSAADHKRAESLLKPTNKIASASFRADIEATSRGDTETSKQSVKRKPPQRKNKRRKAKNKWSEMETEETNVSSSDYENEDEDEDQDEDEERRSKNKRKAR